MMEKTDKSIHNICIVDIKRCTFQPYDDYKWSRFYEENVDFKNAFPHITIELSDNELIICSTVIDSNNFSVLTTQKLVTKENGILSFCDFNNATNKDYGDFKGFEKTPFVLGLIQLDNGDEFKYFIETGKASMIMVHGVKTRFQTKGMTAFQVDKVARIWERGRNR